MRHDYYVAKAMQLYGGSFVQELGKLILLADSDNKLRIFKAWPEYWEEYLKISMLKREEIDRG